MPAAKLVQMRARQLETTCLQPLHRVLGVCHRQQCQQQCAGMAISKPWQIIISHQGMLRLISASVCGACTWP